MVNFIKLFLSFLALAFASACATSRMISGPNGETLHAIDCSGPYSNMGMCLEKAGKICGGAGYELIMGGTTNHGQSASAGQYGYFAAPVVSREIVVRCKGASANSAIPDNAVPGGDRQLK